MKIFLVVISALLLVILAAYIVMAIKSQRAPDTLGINQGRLFPCPDSPNCVCSEHNKSTSGQHDIQAIPASPETWSKLQALITQQHGTIQQSHSNYLHATFSSSIFHFVDDLELRYDTVENVIHLRSASRVGRSDFGKNRQRIQTLLQGI